MDNDKTDTPSLAEARWQALEAYHDARSEYDALVITAAEDEAEAAVVDARSVAAAKARDEAAKIMAEAEAAYESALTADILHHVETRGY